MAQEQPELLKPWERGETITAKKLTEPVDAINRMGGLLAPTQTFGDVTLRLATLEVKTVGDNTLLCYELDGNLTRKNNTVYVAKPSLLRKATYDGTAVNDVTLAYVSNATRSATHNVYTSWVEVQTITEAYVEADDDTETRGSYILAARGISGMPLDLDDDGDTQRVHWLDMNTDGRVWARVFSDTL